MITTPQPRGAPGALPVAGHTVAGSTASALIVTSLFLVLACDPGFRYEPVDWERRDDGAWEYSNEDLNLAMLAPGGLGGSTWLVPEPTIENRTLEIISIDALTLVSGANRYEGQLGAGASRLLSPRERRRAAFFFEVDGPIAKIFSQKVSLTFEYRVGDGELKKLVVLLERAR